MNYISEVVILKMDKQDNTYSVLIKGGISGVLSRTITSPLEVVKIYQQTNKHSSTDILGCMRFIQRTNGWKGFFNGNGTNMYRVIPNTALNFLIFDKLNIKTKQVIKNKDIANLVTGSISGASSISLVYPLETIRTYTTMDKVRYPNVIKTARDIVSRNGVRGLYNGLSMSILSNGPCVGVNFAVFNGLNDFYKTTNPIVYFIYGCVAGTTSKFLTFPIELIRNRMHIQGSSLWKERHYNSIRDAIKTIYSREGFLGFYKGLSVAIIKSSLSIGVMFAVVRMTSTIL